MSALSNAVVLLLIAGAGLVARALSRDRFWRENAVQLWRRRRAALIVVAIYLIVGLLDSISWVSAVDRRRMPWSRESAAISSSSERPANTARP